MSKSTIVISRSENVIVLIGLIVLMCVSAWTLSPVYLQSGWPQNHEYLGFFKRTLVYAQHFQQGDWLPIWSSTDNLGLGSPFPGFYHKLFYLSSGLFYLFIDEMKLSILLTIFFWLCIGGIGMYRLCRKLQCPVWIAWCGSLMIVLSNYAVTDWLIRGAMAELSAMMLVPWCFTAYLEWIQAEEKNKKNSAVLGIMFGLIFLAHTLIAYYLFLIALTSTAFIFLIRRDRFKKVNITSILLFTFTFSIFAGPYIYFKYYFSQSYSMSFLLSPNYLPENNLKPLIDYVWDHQWRWGEKWDSLTIQLDIPLLILLIWALALTFGIKNHSIGKKYNENYIIKLEPLSKFILIYFIICLVLLQTQAAFFLYRFLPGASYIQFPWRLLAILTPLLITLTLVLCSNINIRVNSYAVMLTVIAMLYFCGALSPMHYKPLNIGPQNLDNALFGVNGVYVPTAANSNERLEGSNNIHEQDAEVLIRIKKQISNRLKENKCDLNSLNDLATYEKLKLYFTLSCQNSGIIPLPFFGTKIHTVFINEENTNIIEKQKCLNNEIINGICFIQIKKPGIYNLKIENPTLKKLIF